MKPKDLLHECNHEWIVTDAAKLSPDGNNQFFAMALCKHCRFKISVDEAINVQLYKHIVGKEFWWSIGAIFISVISLIVSVFVAILKP